MSWKNSKERFGTLSMALHWLIFALLVAVVALMELREIFPKGSIPREAMKSWHYLLGMLVLVLALLRVIARWSGPVPALVSGTPGWQRKLATMVHFGLYAIMLGMPVLGWMLLGASSETLHGFGWELPALLAPDEALAEALEEIHEAGAKLAYVLLGLHVCGALYHHFIRHDDTLTRMLPRL